jgi:precorrin-3B C17-methyltransferase
MSGSISIIGIGPGTLEWMAPGSAQALDRADVILGYHSYLQQIASLRPDIPREGSGMRHEVERAQRAIELAGKGKRVAVVSGGDAGIYGMAGLIFEILGGFPDGHLIQVEVLPGITALTAAAALLGAPLMTDFAAISLSDYLIPLDTILNRLDAAIRGDFVICLYNPRSHQRTKPFDCACKKLLDLCGENRPVGVVQAAFRAGQQVYCTVLKDLPCLQIGMDCILVVGNTSTRILNGKMVTSRGYRINCKEQAKSEL